MADTETQDRSPLDDELLDRFAEFDQGMQEMLSRLEGRVESLEKLHGNLMLAALEVSSVLDVVVQSLVKDLEDEEKEEFAEMIRESKKSMYKLIQGTLDEEGPPDPTGMGIADPA